MHLFQIDEEVWDSMVNLGKEKGNKKNKKGRRTYGPGVTDLLKFIRNMGEHYPEKDDE